MTHRLVVAALVLTPAVALAEPKLRPQPDLAAAQRLAFTLGLFTPTGEVGLEYTAMLTPHLELGLGVGKGVLGAQGAVMPRLHWGEGDSAVTLGAGVSGGPYTEPEVFASCPDDGSGACVRTHTTVLWTNAEVGYQATSRSGALIRVYGGAGRLLSHGHCSDGGCGSLDGMVLPYFGIALGQTL